MIEIGTHLRVKLMGTRRDVGNVFAIGSTEEDFLGLFLLTFLYYFSFTNNTSGHPDITILHGIQLIQEQPHNYDGRYLDFFILWSCIGL